MGSTNWARNRVMDFPNWSSTATLAPLVTNRSVRPGSSSEGTDAQKAVGAWVEMPLMRLSCWRKVTLLIALASERCITSETAISVPGVDGRSERMAKK